MLTTALVGLGSGALASAVAFLARYPRRPVLRPAAPVGTLITRWTSGPAVQIFYPSTGEDGSGPGAWFRPAVVDRIAGMIGLPGWCLRFLSCPAPFPVNPPPAADGLPVVLFSHGLMGSLDMYKTLCGGIAAGGYIVLAVEHEDGSALHAQTAEREAVVRRTVPTGFKYQREAVVDFRAQFLAKRAEELLRVQQAAMRGDRADESPGAVQAVMARADTGAVYLAGHSFGAASVVHAAPTVDRLAGAVLLDLWPFPLPDPVLTRGMETSTLVLTSEQFVNGREFGLTRRLIRNSQDMASFYIPGSAHQSFSDTPLLLPRFIGCRIGMNGTSDTDRTYQAMIDAILLFLKRCRFELKDESSLQAVREQILAENPMMRGTDSDDTRDD